MPNILLAESGSTKTDWCLIRKRGKPVYFKTSGINPYLQSRETIQKLLTEELAWDDSIHKADRLCFYGAGAGRPLQQGQLKDVLSDHFKINVVDVQGDLLAAARALCQGAKGIVCILGTGSNSCYFDGQSIQEQQTSLGYIAGDEGSGNHMGKRVLQYYAYKTFDEELKAGFEILFGNDVGQILHRLYNAPFPNRYLAGLVQLLVKNRGHFMVENIIEDSLNDFFHVHILKYKQSWKEPLYFTGSIAHEFDDVLLSLCQQYELDFGGVSQSPLAGLVRYHKDLL